MKTPDLYDYVPAYLLEQWDQHGFARIGGHTARHISEHRERKLLAQGILAVLSLLLDRMHTVNN